MSSHLKFKDIKMILHITSGNKELLNLCVPYSDFYEESPFPYFYCLDDETPSMFRNFYDFYKSEFTLNLEGPNLFINGYDFEKFNSYEKAVTLLMFAISDYGEENYYFNVSINNKNDALIKLKNLCVDEKLIDGLLSFEDEDSPITINILEEDVSNLSASTSFNIYFDIETMELSFGELFEEIDNNINNESVQAAYLYYYYFNKDEIKILEKDEEAGESISLTITEEESEILGELFDEEPSIKTIKNEKLIFKWLSEGVMYGLNIFKFNNKKYVLKFSPQSVSSDSDLYERKIHNINIFDKSRSPNFKTQVFKKCDNC